MLTRASAIKKAVAATQAALKTDRSEQIEALQIAIGSAECIFAELHIGYQPHYVRSWIELGHSM